MDSARRWTTSARTTATARPTTDRTNFFEDVPVSALERTLYLEADRMGFLAAQSIEAMLERERGVVQNEKRQGENQPYGRVFGRIVERMFPPVASLQLVDHRQHGGPRRRHARGRQGAGTARTTGRTTACSRWPATSPPTRALELVKKYFGGIPPGPPMDASRRWVPRLDANIRDEMQDRVPQTRIYRVYHAPAWRDAELQQSRTGWPAC